MELNIANVGLLLTLVGCIVGFLTYNLAKKKEDKQEIKEDVTKATTFKNEIDNIKEELGKLKNDPSIQTRIEMQLEHIKQGVDDIKTEIKDVKIDAKTSERKINELVEKVARLDESLKSVHKRVDELELKK